MRCNMSNDKPKGGTFEFNTGAKKAGKNKTGIAKLSGAQSAFRDNCLNIALNTAKLESADAFPKSAHIEVSTTGAKAVMPDGSKVQLFTFDDYRKGTYNIDINA